MSETHGRNLGPILDFMVREVESHGIDAAVLARIRFKVDFTAPELMGDRWMDAQAWIERTLPLADKQPWIEKLMAVWVGRHVAQP